MPDGRQDVHSTGSTLTSDQTLFRNDRGRGNLSASARALSLRNTAARSGVTQAGLQLLPLPHPALCTHSTHLWTDLGGEVAVPGRCLSLLSALYILSRQKAPAQDWLMKL